MKRGIFTGGSIDRSSPFHGVVRGRSGGFEEAGGKPVASENPLIPGEGGGDFGRRILGLGRSGRIYDRQVTIRTPPREIGAKLPLPNFSARLLLSSVALVTYQSILRDPDGTVRHTLRSSVWTRTDRGWRLVFHQGTPIQSS